MDSVGGEIILKELIDTGIQRTFLSEDIVNKYFHFKQLQPVSCNDNAFRNVVGKGFTHFDT